MAEVGRARRWTDEEVRLVRSVAEHCAIAVARADLYEDARRRATELELTISEMADGFLMCNERLDVVRANAAARQMLWDAPLVGVSIPKDPPRVAVEELDGRPIARESYPIVVAVLRGEVVRNREMVLRHLTSGRKRTVVVTAS
ncbi:hypothetical protein HY251_18685, partial [bacterium]|nr:hypothetical protein [bacterium]